MLTKKVLNYFEVMINYIIAVTLHARRNNLMSFVLTNALSDDITTVMISYWIDSVVTLELKPSASSKVCLICTGPGLALTLQSSSAC